MTSRSRRPRRRRGFTPAQLAQRAAALPVVEYPDLPVAERREEIAAAIRDHQVVIVSGETGSGKTTQIPKIALQLGRGIGAMIGHTQPRRLAARAVAERIASELGQEMGRAPGQVIGYQVRFTDEVGPTTLVKLMTDGILLNEIQVDPDLRRYDTLIIDEAHERSLNIDFILGYLARLLPRRPDLKVIITSATIDSKRFAAHFAKVLDAPVPVIEVTGRTYPVEIRYRPLKEDLATPVEAPEGAFQQLVLEAPDDDLAVLGYGLGDEIDLEQGLVEATEELLSEGEGDILVFLPGERDIREAQVTLEDHLRTRRPPLPVEVIPLFARLSGAEQHRIFAPHEKRRIILSTNIAETSLTVPGIRYVIDAGLARISRFSNKTKVQRLPIERVSQASANQRAGRAGRLSDGVAIRLYSAGDYAGRPQFTEPEILRTSLASVILQMVSLGLGEVSDFPFLDPPSSRAVRDGVQLLVEIGALTEAGDLTPVGRQLSRLPIDPRLGRMLLAGDANGCASEVLVVIAALSIQDVRERPLEAQKAADEAHARFNDSRSDFVTYLNLWRYLNVNARDLSGSAFRRLCRREYLHYMRFREWRDVVGQLRQMCREISIKVDPLGEPSQQEVRRHGSAAEAVVAYGKSTRAVDYDQLHRSILVGLLSNVGTWDQPKAQYLGARQTRFSIWPGSGLAGAKPAWVMAAELVETSRLFARTVAQIRVEWIEETAGHLLHRSYSEPYWSRAKGAAFIKEKVSLYGLVLAADRPVLLSRLGELQLGSRAAPSVRAPRPGSLAALAQGLLTEKSALPWASKFVTAAAESEEITAAGLAREMFIQEALVEGNWRGNHLAFVRHNRKLFAEAEDLQHRSRKGTLIASPERLHEFFAERIPTHVTNARQFEKWWKRQRETAPHLLDLRWSDLVTEEPKISGQGYPDVWKQGRLRLPLRYDFSPGSPADGVTVRIPVAVLPQVEDQGFDWLVPGLWEELCTETIRALPKDKRRLLAPAPDLGREIAARLRPGEAAALPAPKTAPAAESPYSLEASLGRLAKWAEETGARQAGTPTPVPPPAEADQTATAAERKTPPASRDFFPAFAALVRELRGVELTEADGAYAAERLPAHLQMHFEVVDAKGKTIATGPSVTELRTRLSKQAGKAVRSAVRDAVRIAAADGNLKPGPAADEFTDLRQKWEARDLQTFPVDLPAALESTGPGGLPIRAYPGLAPRGSAADPHVDLELFPTAAEAEKSTREGVAYFLLRDLKLPTARVTTRWSGAEALRLAAAPTPSTKTLVAAAQLAAAVALTQSLLSGPVRSSADYEALVSAARDRFEEEVYQILQLTVRAVEAAGRLETSLADHAEASLSKVRQDVLRGRDRLFSPEFLEQTPRRRLDHLPRYLDALAQRVERAARDPQALSIDEDKAQTVRRLHAEWEEAVQRASTRPLDLREASRLEELRWLLEELRVSLFAEQLGTSERISPERFRRRLASLGQL